MNVATIEEIELEIFPLHRGDKVRYIYYEVLRWDNVIMEVTKIKANNLVSVFYIDKDGCVVYRTFHVSVLERV